MDEAAAPSRPAEEAPASVDRAARAWRRVGYRVRSTTPSDVVHLAMVVGALALIVWLAVATWPALAPFVAGAIVAYALLPLVNRLDRVMPRLLAVVVALVLFVAAVGGFLALLLPAIADQLTHVIQQLPSPEQVRQVVDHYRAMKTTLPEPVQALLAETADQVSTNARANLINYLRVALGLAVGSVISLLGTVGFVLGFLVVPGWLLTVLKDQRAGVRAMDRLLPVWLRPDFWAVLRIVDRAFRSFLNGQFIVAVAVGTFTYLGLRLLNRVDLGIAGNQLLLALVIGVLHLVPEVGPFLAVVLIAAAGLTQSVEVAIALVALLIGVQMLVNRFITPQLSRREADIHPAVLVLAIVALSQLGILWVLVAAPVASIARDLFRYVFGRFNDSPSPAGLLPGETVRRVVARRRINSAQLATSWPVSPPRRRRGRASSTVGSQR
jgi:predicted PurR-regulated permease PerM